MKLKTYYTLKANANFECFHGSVKILFCSLLIFQKMLYSTRLTKYICFFGLKYVKLVSYSVKFIVYSAVLEQLKTVSLKKKILNDLQLSQSMSCLHLKIQILVKGASMCHPC